MQLVGAGFCDYVHHCAGVSSILGVKGVGDDPKLFDRIRAGLDCREVRKLIVSVAAIHAEVVGASAAAIHRNHTRFVAAVKQIRTRLRLHSWLQLQ